MLGMEALQHAELAAKERARRIVEDLKRELEADQSLTSRDRYLIWGKLARECGQLALRGGRPY